MTDKPPPNRKDTAGAARQARLEREAAALRANLHRRKAQARAQADNGAMPPEEPGPDRIVLPDNAGKA